MIIYQVLDENNKLVKEFTSFEAAVQNAENLTLWSTEHYFHIEKTYHESSLA